MAKGNINLFYKYIAQWNTYCLLEFGRIYMFSARDHTQDYLIK